MNTTVYGEGEFPSDVMIIGERPGFDEARNGRPFIGPAGDELWSRLFDVCSLSRDDVYTTNLVKTFSKEPPSKKEIAHWSGLLRSEIERCRPKVIITIGYHAARHLLPQFVGYTGDYFAGLAFPFTYGILRPRTTTVVPCVHTSAALRQPERYQNQLTRDFDTVRRVLAGEQPHHTSRRVTPYRVGLSSISRDREPIGVDSEYNSDTGDVYVVTLSSAKNESCAIEIDPSKPVTPYLVETLTGRRIISHMAKAEYHALKRIGLDLLVDVECSVDDTMLKAYLLQLPQSLKVLSYRLLGYEMDEYEDLIAPLDKVRVVSALEEAHARYARLHIQHAHDVERTTKVNRRLGTRAKAAKEAALDALGKEPTTTNDEGETIVVPKRAVSSLYRFIYKEEKQAESAIAAAESGDGDGEGPKESLRKRWSKSTFSRLAPLPPVPTWRDLSSGVRLDYAMTDAVAHREVDQILDPLIDERGLRKIYEIDRAVLPMLVRNEQVGLAVDAKQLRRLGAQFKDELESKIVTLKLLTGKDVNPMSGPDVATLLFDELGVTPTRMTKGGKHFTTADKYLKARRHEHEAITHILDARQLSKYIGTYTERLPDLLRAGRYHPDWKYTRTATGRLAEEIILLVPKHDPLAKEQGRPNRAKALRNCFHAVDGHRLVSVDLSQIELRTMADLSRDERLLRAYAKGEDIHAAVAHALLGAPKKKADQDESKHRLPAKTINFGIINGMTEYGMLDQLHENGQLHWTIDDVREMLVGWFKIHAGVQTYWDNQIAKARRLGYVTSKFGRRRYIAGVHSTSEQVRREAERQCLCPIQATADEISKIWNARIWRRIILREWRDGKYCEPWVRVHDDTTVECDERRAGAIAKRMLELVPQELSIPTTAEAKGGQQWGDLHDLDKAA